MLRLMLLVVILASVAGATGALVVLAAASSAADLPSWITAWSAATQAVAAVLIIVLTIRLANTAAAALKESDRQAKIAEKALGEASAQTGAALRANDEARKQRQLGAIPLLDVRCLGSSHGNEGRLMTVFELRNPGPNNALDIRLYAYGMTSDRHVDDQERHRSTPVPLLSAGQDTQVLMPMQDFENVPNPALPPDKAWFSNDWIRIVAICQGVTGGRVSLRYDWAANAKGLRPEQLWQLKEVKLIPDPDDLKWQIVLDTSRG